MSGQKDIELNDIKPIVPNELFKTVSIEFSKLLKKICDKNNLDYDIIKQQYNEDIVNIGSKIGIKKRNRRVLPPNLQCMGRKLDGVQCTRGKRDTSDYCKSHENKLPYGRIDEPFKGKEMNKRGRKKKNKNNDYILTHMEIIDGNNYLIDEKNYVYSFNINNPEFLGIKVNNKIVPQ